MSVNISNFERRLEEYTKSKNPLIENNAQLLKPKMEMMINWVNSLEYPNCLLASDIEDFKNGVIFCELVNEIILNNQKPDYLPSIKLNNPTYQESLNNIRMALNEIKIMKNTQVPKNILNFSDEDLLKDENKIYQLLEFLYKLATNHGHKTNESTLPVKNLKYESSEKGLEDMTLSMPSAYLSTQFSYDSASSINNAAKESFRTLGIKPPLKPSSAKKPSKLAKKSDVDSSQINISRLLNSPHNDGRTANSFYGEKNTTSFNYDINDPYGSYLYMQIEKQNNSMNNQSTQNNNIITINEYKDNDFEYNYNQFSTELTSPKITNIDSNNNLTTMPSTNRLLVNSGNQFESQYGLQTFNGFNSFKNANEIEDKKLISQDLFSEAKPMNESSKSNNNIFSEEYGHDNIQTNYSESKRFTKRIKSEPIEENARQKSNYSQISTSPASKKNKDISKLSYLQDNLASALKKKTLKDENIIITPVSQQVKEKILDWLCSITLLKENLKDLDKKLPKICRNGLIFVDLINRLESKHEIIKGIDRNPKIKSALNANYVKIMDYLNQFEKMNPRYFKAQKYLIEGNDDVFWGFMDDIWCFYNKKISPHDPRMHVDNTKKNLKSMFILNSENKQNSDVSYNDISYTNHFDKKKNTRLKQSKSPKQISKSPIKKQNDYEIIQSKIPVPFLQENSNNTLIEKVPKPKQDELPIETQKPTEERVLEKKTSYVNIHTKKLQCDSLTPKKSNSRSRPITPSSKEQMRSGYKWSQESGNKITERTMNTSMSCEKNNLITAEMEAQIEEWLKKIGFIGMIMKKDRPLFEDPSRNGVLLCKLIKHLEIEKFSNVYLEPRSIDECRFNVDQAFTVLKKKNIRIPVYMLTNIEAVIQGDRNIIMGILHSLMKSHEKKKSSSVSADFFEKEHSYYEISGLLLPYSEKDLEILRQSLMKWLNMMGIFSDIPTIPTTFEQFHAIIRNGVLICDLVGIIGQTGSIAVYRKPTTEIHCLINIRKALEVLRSNKKMSQKFLWKEKEIFAGNRLYILGFFEDLHRLFDDQPPRQNPNYYFDGPYLGNNNDNKYTIQDVEKTKREKFAKAINKLQKKCQDASMTASIENEEKSKTSNNLSFEKMNKKQSHNKFGEKLLPEIYLGADEPISLLNFGKKSSEKSEIIKEIYDNQPLENSLWFGLPPAYPSAAVSNHDKTTAKGLGNIKNGLHLKNCESEGNSHKEKSNLTGKGSRQIDSLIDWLKTLGFNSLIEHISLGQDIINEFKDGLILCKIIEKLEMKDIPGIIMKPVTNASKLVNIRKSLQTFSKRPGFNPCYLNVEEKILNGDGATIRELLWHMKDIYKFIIAVPTKTTTSKSTSILGALENRKSTNENSKYILAQEYYVQKMRERGKKNMEKE